MAYADYRHCDKCDEKVFYDANLNYGNATDGPCFRKVGVIDKYDNSLEGLGDWAVLCIDCSKTHKTQIVPIKSSKSAGA